MLLNSAQIKLWHLARQHVNSDSGVQHTAASLEDKVGKFGRLWQKKVDGGQW